MTQFLDQRHANYSAVDAVRTAALDFFSGAETVKKKSKSGKTYLFQEANEKDVDFTFRLNRAPFDPIAGLIIEARQGALFRKSHVRVVQGKAERWVENVNLSGDTAGVFFERVARNAQVSGMDWVLVNKRGLDTDEDGKRNNVTVAEQEEQRLRPFFSHIPGQNVINWKTGEDGRLEWVVIELMVVEPSKNPETAWMEEPVIETEWHVWTRKEWFVFRKSEGTGKEAATFEEKSHGKHPVGEVPIVPFYGIREGNFLGWPVFKDCLPNIINVFNLESDLDWFLRLTGHPVPVLSGARKIEMFESANAIWLQQEAGDPTPQWGYLEPTGKSIEGMEKRILKLMQRIYATSLQQSLRDSAQVQSADSQREDRRAYASSLMVVSQGLEQAERRCWDFLSRWEVDKGVKHEITYNRDFDDTIVEASFIAALGTLVNTKILSAETTREILKGGEVLPETFDEKEEQRRLLNETETQAMAGFDNSSTPDGDDKQPDDGDGEAA